MTQNQLGLELIHATLYKKQQWKPMRCGCCDTPMVGAKTQFNKSIIRIWFNGTPIISVNYDIVTRMKKEIKIDLINLVKLKLTKKHKNV